jgi:hypothetical protein
MQLLSEHNDCMYMIMMCSWTLCEGGGQDFCDRLLLQQSMTMGDVGDHTVHTV